MLHPLFKTLATEPQTLLEHAAAYAALATEETRHWLHHGRRRAIWLAVGVLCLLIGLILAGGAMLVLAAVPYDMLARPALLWLTPGVPLLAGAAALWVCHAQQGHDAFTLTRAQWALDRAVLDRVESRA